MIDDQVALAPALFIRVDEDRAQLVGFGWDQTVQDG